MTSPVGLRRNATSMDYSSLDGAILSAPLVKPCDFDGVITHHRTGRVLFFEHKQIGEFDRMTTGQRITIDDVAALNPAKGRVMVVEHTGKMTDIGAFLFDPVRIMFWDLQVWMDCDIIQFRTALNEWWEKTC